MLWNVHDPKGQLLGPFTTEQLIRGLQHGQLSPHSWLRRETDPGWQPLASFEAFSNFCDEEAEAEPNGGITGARMALAWSALLLVFAVGWLTF